MLVKTLILVLFAVLSFTEALNPKIGEFRNKRQGFGAPSPFSNEDALAYLVKNFAQIDKEIIPTKVTKATSQTVAGTIYEIVANFKIKNEEKKDCNVYVTESLKDEATTKVDCPDGYKKEFSHKRAKRQVVGGHSTYSNEDALAYLVKNFAQTGEKIKPIDVTRATSQTVAGVIYNIYGTIEVNNEQKKNCHTHVTESLQGDTTTEIDCPDGYKKEFSHKRAKRQVGVQVAGGVQTATHEEGEAVINKYVGKIEKLKGLVLVKILEVKKQVVAGTLTDVQALFKTADGKEETCKFVIVEKSWVQDEEGANISYDCKVSGKAEVKHKFVA